MTESDFNNVSRTLLNAIRKFYEKEENIKAFEIWQAERQKLQLNKKHKNMNNHFSGMKKNVKELSKLLEDMFPKEKKEEGKRK